MAKAKVIAFTEFRCENKEFIPINLIFVRKDFNVVDFTGIISHCKFYNLKDYMDYILTIARNNNFSIDYVSQFGCKFYNIMYRNADYGDIKYNNFAYKEGQ